MRDAGLVGRDTEIVLLAELAQHAAQGQGRVVLLEGEPGIGKTALLDAAADRFGRQGLRVLSGTAHELDERIPFASINTCWADSADEGIAKLGRLLRGGDGFNPADAHYAEYAAIEHILTLVDRWCAAGPVALILDDVQWADPATLIVLNRLVGVAAQLPLLLVLAHRAVSGGPILTLLHRASEVGHAAVVRLEPLSGDAVAALVEKLVDAHPAAGLLAVVDAAGGNPLYVRSLVASLSGDHLVTIADGDATVPPDAPLPPSLSAAIVRQLDFVSPPTRRALLVAALIGTSFDVGELATLLAASPLALLGLVREAIDVGLVVEQAETLVFRHELIRRALYDELAPASRVMLHLEAGRLLAAAGAPVERVASHFAEAGVVDASVAAWLATASEELRICAPRLAVDLLRGAVSQAGAAGAFNSTLAVRLAAALLWAGMTDEALSQAQTTLARVDDPGAERTLRWVVAQSSFRLGRLDQAAAESRAALPVAASDAIWFARFHGLLAQCLLLSGKVGEAEATASQVLLETGDTPVVVHARLVLSMIRLNQGRGDESLALADRVVEDLGADGARPDVQVGPFLARGRALIQLDRLADAVEALEEGRRAEEERGGVFLGLHHQVKALARFWEGRWDDALAELRAGLEVGDALGLTRTSSAMIDLIAFHRGRPADGGQEPPAAASGRYLHMISSWVEALALEGSGDADGAVDLLSRLARFLENGIGSYDRLWLYPDLARLCTTHGQGEPLGWMLADLHARRPTRSVQATAALVAGLARDDLAALGEAVTQFRAAGIPLFEGYAHEQAAVLLAKRGEQDAARGRLEAARLLFSGLDAGWDIARAEARLRGFGVRSGSRGRQRRPKTGWAALTSAEGKVAALVARGYSNPDIAAQLYVSRRTVQAHLTSIFTKLGLSTRVELAVLAASPAVGRSSADG